MLALGIDPGTAICGYGVVELKNNVLRPVHYGSVFTDKELRPELRLKKVYEEITDVITRFRPEVMSIEKLFFARNVNTAIPVAQSRGVVLLAGDGNRFGQQEAGDLHGAAPAGHPGED